MRNLRSYESADLTLGPGTTLLSGDVGSGKTSLLYAIEMALFGFAEVDPTYLVRHQAGDAEVVLSLADAAHRYEFGRRFRRRRRKGRDLFELESASYSVDGATTPYSVTEIRQRAIALLGFPDNPNPRAHSDLWRWAVYVPQERMREVLAQEPEERLTTVRKALGLEQYRTAAENAQLVAAELRRMAERAEAEARGRDHLQEERPLLNSELEERESQLRRHSTQLESAQAEVRAAEAHLAEVDARVQAHQRDRGEESQLVDRLRADEERLSVLLQKGAELERELAAREGEHDARAALERRRADGVAELRALDIALEELRAQRETSSQDVATLAAAEARLAAAVDARDHSVEEVARSERELVAIQHELDRLLAEGPQKEPPAPTHRTIVEIDAAMEEVRTRIEGSLSAISRNEHVAAEDEELRTQGVCPRCHQTVNPEEFAVHHHEVQAQLDRERAELSGLRAALDRLGDERRSRERYERSHLRWTDLESARASGRGQRDRAARQCETARSRGAELERAVQAGSAEVERLRPLAARARTILERLDGTESERADRERQNAEITASLEAAQAAAAHVARLREDQTTSRNECAEVERQLADRRAALGAVRLRLAGLPALTHEAEAARRRLSDARESTLQTARARERAEALVESSRARIAEVDRLLIERQERLDAARRHRELASWFGGAFREAVLTLEQRLLARARSEFEHDFSRFFTLLVEDPALIARCDAAFSPSVEIEGEWTPAEALSGGERTALALAFRLALGQVVRAAGRLQLETLILDEPTDGFSPEQVVRMGELLEGLGIPQVILVSHESQLTSIADRVVLVRKDGGRSVLVAGPAPGDAAGGSPSATTAPLAPRRRVRTPRLDAAEPRTP